MNTTNVPVQQPSVAAGKVWFFSLPVMLGIASWLAIWTRTFAFDNHYLNEAEAKKVLMVMFVLMLWIGPFSGTASIILARNSQVVGWKRTLCYVLNGFWGLFALFSFIGYCLWRRGLWAF